MAKTLETINFSANSEKVLKMMIKSIYTNKEIFLRELISNALDAVEKRRFLSVSDEKLCLEDDKYQVIVEVDENKKTISITDNGIGMTKDELINNLGVIAYSGTENFVKNLENARDKNMIGQFGVGFYSAFIIAEHVTVVSKKAGTTEGYVWESDSNSSFTIEKCYDVCEEGTKVILNVKKEDQEEFLDRFQLKHTAESFFRYSPYTIKIIQGREVEELKNKTALWNANKKYITDGDYLSLYKSLSMLPDKPMVTIHYNSEGLLEFGAILFIPSMTPVGVFNPDRCGKVKLYVKGVFINEGKADLIPAFFRFVYGVVECNDLPLNISRESLQHNAVIKKIGDILVKKIIGEVQKLRANNMDEYLQFWNNMGLVWKEGLCEATPYRDDVLENALFYTTKSQSVPITLRQYTERMMEGQKEIYYCYGDGISGALSSPDLEMCLKNNVEVVLLGDPVDGFWTAVVSSYNCIPLRSISSVNTTMDFIKQEKKDEEINKDEMASLFSSALNGMVKEIVVSHKLTDSPMCLSVPEGSMSISTEAFLILQKQLARPSLKILEINPSHPLNLLVVKKMQDPSTLDDGITLAKTMFEIACVAQGEVLKNNGLFAKNLNSMLTNAFTGSFVVK